MKKIFRYKYTACNEINEVTSSFSFNAPFFYYGDKLKDKDKKLDNDFCRLKDHYFIRTILEIPIIGTKKAFLWGVWVSQSEENFKYYLEHFNNDLLGRETFGWFANVLPYYEDTLNLKTIVLFQNNKNRPKLHIQESEHELSKDYHNGISEDKAIKIATIAKGE